MFYFWLCWVFVVAHGVSQVAAPGGYPPVGSALASLQWLFCCRAWALGQQLWHMDSAAP